MVSDTTADPYQLMKLPTEFWSAEKIKPYPKNHKVHSKEDNARLRKSIEEFGLLEALIVDRNGVIIAGHGRFQVLLDMGRIRDIPVKVAAHLSESQADAARIAHNKAQSTDYDTEALSEELQRIFDDGEIDMDSLGLLDKEKDFLIPDIGELDEDALSTDLETDLDEQDAETEQKVQDTDDSDVRIADAFGFKTIPIAAQRGVRKLLAEAEAQTGKTGQEAFVEWLDAR